MRNQNLKTQCEYFLSSLELFKSSARLACSQDDGIVCKDEEKFLSKLDKKIDALTEHIRNSP